MSTVKKGNAFEERVFQCFKDAMKEGKLYISSDTSKIFRKKSYYSRDREADVIVDISIETFIPGASSYSLLTIIECKDYVSSIPIDDIQELHDKVRQIAGNRGKAIFVTNSSLQKSALTYAKNNMIAIARILPDNQVDWTLHYLTPDMLRVSDRLNSSEFNSAFLNQGHTGKNRDFYGSYNNCIFGSLEEMLIDVVSQKEKSQ